MTRQKNPIRSRAITYPVREAMLALLAGFAFLAAAMLVAAPAHGQVLSSTPYVPAPDPAVESLRNRLNALEGDLKAAVDRSEKLAYDLAQSRKAAEEANTGLKASQAEIESLKARVEALETAGPGANRADLTSARGAQAAEAVALVPAPAANAASADALPQGEDDLLKEANRLLIDGRYAEAQQAASTFLSKYPKSSSAASAQYTLAESLLLQENFADAAAAYGKLLKSYPKSPNAPNALVKLARSMRLMGKPAESCKTLDLLAQQYPKAPGTTKTLAETERGYAKCKAS